MVNLARVALLNGLLAFLYLTLGRITFDASVQYGNVTSVVFAPEGVALAFSILFGPKIAPGIVLGQTLLSYWSGPSIMGGLVIGIINACEAMLGGYLFRRWKLSPQFTRFRDFGRFAGMIFLILQPISATGGVLVLLLNGMIPFNLSNLFLEAWNIQGVQQPLPSLQHIAPAWLHWWMGNSLGQILVAPLLLAWLTPTQNHTPPLRWFELLALAVVFVIIPLLAKSELRANALLFLALSYTLLTWMGQRCGIRVVTVANLVFTALVVWVGMSGSGFMSYLPEAERFFHISFFIATGVLFSMLLSTTLEERRALIHQLTELAIKDELTQLSNRRHFQECAQNELVLAQRHGGPTCMALLDLDHFKAINDTHGHAFGDEVLKMFAQGSTSVLRPGDLLGRIGGEEFALLLPRTELAAASQVVQRLLDKIAGQVTTTADGTNVRVTVSAGLTEAVAGAPLSTLFHEADQALYQAKKAGRNRVWAFESAPVSLTLQAAIKQ